MSHAIGACPSGQSELKWCTRGLDHLPELAGQRFGDQPAKRGPRRDAAYSSILFLESCHRGKHESLRRPKQTFNISLVHPPGPGAANTC